jgi:hypothetical protein
MQETGQKRRIFYQTLELGGFQDEISTSTGAVYIRRIADERRDSGQLARI